jgi:ribosome-binding protein aMBF1 (putative translation factor)
VGGSQGGRNESSAADEFATPEKEIFVMNANTYKAVDNFCRSIKNLRLERGWTLEWLAEQLGVHCGTLSHWERCVRYPSIDYALALAEVFGRSLDEMLGGCNVKVNSDEFEERIVDIVKRRFKL